MFALSLFLIGTALSALAFHPELEEKAAATVPAHAKVQLKGNSFCVATMNSSEVHLMTCSNDAAQKWIWESVGNKDGVQHYTIKSEAEGVCLSKEHVEGEPTLERWNLTAGRPEYVSSRLRPTLEPCSNAYSWGWYGDRLCIRDCELHAALHDISEQAIQGATDRMDTADVRVLSWR